MEERSQFHQDSSEGNACWFGTVGTFGRSASFVVQAVRNQLVFLPVKWDESRRFQKASSKRQRVNPHCSCLIAPGFTVDPPEQTLCQLLASVFLSGAQTLK